jgi:hypothetical protein
VETGLTNDAISDEGKTGWFYAWRDVGPTERTLVGTIVPRTAVGNVAPILFSPLPVVQRCALSAILQSLVADYAARQKSSRMSMFVIEQVPALAPKQISEAPEWLGSRVDSWLSDRVLELSYTNYELAAFASDLGRDHPPFHWQPERRVLLQAEIDAAVLHLYGLDRSQAEWLIDSFKVLRKYEQRDHGEFRTKRLVLEIYDEMTTAEQSSSPYRTRLDPVPADPSCCHPVPVR